MCSGIAAQIKLNQEINFQRYADGTFFHIVMFKVDGEYNLLWAPANNIGPGGERVTHYNWARYKNGREVRRVDTTTGNGGHQELVSVFPWLNESLKTTLNLVKKETSELKADLDNLEASEISLIKHHIGNVEVVKYLSGERKSLPRYMHSEGKQVLKRTRVAFERFKIRKKNIESFVEQQNFVILGGGIELFSQDGQTKGLVRLTSRSNNWRLLTIPSVFGFYINHIGLPEDLKTFFGDFHVKANSQNTAMSTQEMRGLVDIEFRRQFVDQLGRLTPNLPIKLVDAAYLDLSSGQKGQLTRIVNAHNQRANLHLCD